jgi:hypothetical protein
MAQVEVLLLKVGGNGFRGDEVPVFSSEPVLHEVLTSSGSNAVTSGEVPTGGIEQLVWQVKAIGGAVRVKFGADPVAANSAGGGFHLDDGQTQEWAAVAGHKAAVIDA